jgi:hypothetical protein
MFHKQLRLTLTTMNVIESAFALVEKLCFNVKHWHAADHESAGLVQARLSAKNSSAASRDTNRFRCFLIELHRLFLGIQILPRGERHRKVSYSSAATFPQKSGVPPGRNAG